MTEPNPADVLIERLSNCFGYNCASGETCQNHNEPLILEARDEIERLRAALEWYAEQVSHVRKIHSEGDDARQALSDDCGQRAIRALSQEKPNE